MVALNYQEAQRELSKVILEIEKRQRENRSGQGSLLEKLLQIAQVPQLQAHTPSSSSQHISLNYKKL